VVKYVRLVTRYGLIVGLWLSFIVGTSPAWAKELTVVLKLVRMEAEALTEDNGDEIYISLTKYSNQNPPEELRIPSAPANWFFKKLDRLKDVILWEGQVAVGEELKFMLSVAEQDFPPWDVDELIGTVQVNVKNDKGRLKPKWSIPKMDGQPVIEDLGIVREQGRRYMLHGDNSKYDIQLSLEAGAKKP